MALDDEAEALEQLGDDLSRRRAIAGRIVGRRLDDLGEEAGFRVAVGDDEIVDGGLDGGRHGLSRGFARPVKRRGARPSLSPTTAERGQARRGGKDCQNPSMRMPS